MRQLLKEMERTENTAKDGKEETEEKEGTDTKERGREEGETKEDEMKDGREAQNCFDRSAASQNSGGRKKEEDEDAQIRENGQLTLGGREKGKIHLLSIIGEIEGHENLSGSMKTTKYEHVLPKLAEVEDDRETEGILVLINTVGGDVSCGLALAEMLASLSKPTVSLVIGDSHSIGVPLAVATDYSFIVPTGTMMIHPVRMTGMVIGTAQTYDYFEMIQDRILSFVSGHSRISYGELRALMHNTRMLTRDLGTVLVGKEAVEKGLINEVGGVKDALKKLYEMM